MLDEFLSLGRVEKLVHALSYVRGWGIRIATVIQSEAQLQAVYGRELAEFFINNHRARVYYRPPVHRRDLAEAIAKVIGRTTVKQMSYSYGPGRRSRQVAETGQARLEADEIAHRPDHETIVMVDGVRPLIAHKRRYYRDKTFKTRRLAPVPPPPIAAEPLEALGGEASRREGSIEPRYTSEASVREALDAIPVPESHPTAEEIEAMAAVLANVIHHADPNALAALAAHGTWIDIIGSGFRPILGLSFPAPISHGGRRDFSPRPFPWAVIGRRIA